MADSQLSPDPVTTAEAAGRRKFVLTSLARNGHQPEQILAAVFDLWPRLRPAVQTLPIPSATSRHGDQHTSTAAGARHATPDLGRFSTNSSLALLLDSIDTNEGLTAYEATARVLSEDASHTRWEGCRRRVSDLLRAGLIEDSGVTRQNPGSDTESIVWKTTRAGRSALKRLAETGWSK